ncbi:phage holin [Serratia sp. PF2-63]|uniref:HP1 family phage holin n=1 Tax=unclassified Serratia (in: enterobacteria) TaxID=2647522 RepID=UPI0024AEBA5B|nr:MULTISPECIES: HP1 family phage holin [unclassified Serratia (in: enterobacteria)]MDI6935459.1 phage holin [Serratia sp. Se-PFBMAAmG]MDI6977559.1 phage holin [Serratia sp. Se-RSBMAAmG]MDI9262437.1 phage holin [Serratia sp. PF2-63]MDI9271290.1 phage holin [Serratia sp. PF-27]
MKMDKYSSQLSYWVASLLAAAGAMTLQDWAVLVGIFVAVFTAGVNWYYKRKLVNKLTAVGYDKERAKAAYKAMSE